MMLDFNDRAPYRKILLVGNPNCGKTTLFNVLTGSHQRVGNWSGVTVEQKQGILKGCHGSMILMDLPGTYALYPWNDPLSLDEKVTAECIKKGVYDCILNVVDASSLERNLYLTLQLLERGLPVIVAFNRMDLLQKRGISIDEKKVAAALKCPVVFLSASTRQGLDKLVAALEGPLVQGALSIPYPSAYESFYREVVGESVPFQAFIRSLEGESIPGVPEHILNSLTVTGKTIEQHEPDILIAKARYDWIEALLKQVLTKSCLMNKVVGGESPNSPKSLDYWVLHRVFGIPIFLFIMYLLFFFAINVGGAFQEFFDNASQLLFVDVLWQICQKWQFNDVLSTILTSGVGKGINTIVTFIPVIGAMFLALAFLEDSGYMTRAAFVMDRFMRALGLPGKSFVPLIVGFGCNVPAIMGARTLEQKRDRILTVMISPFMSCGARLAIFTLFVSAFFENNGQNIVFLLYLIGVSMAILTGLMLKKTLLRGKSEPLVLELPSYQWPTWNNVLFHTWHRLKMFLVNAGKLIIPVCIIIGALNEVTIDMSTKASSHEPTVLAEVAKTVTPIFHPMGIEQDNWPATVGLFTGMMAKEVVIGTLNSLYAQEAGFEGTRLAIVDIKQGLIDAVLTIPERFGLLAGSLVNPVKGASKTFDLKDRVFGEMQKRFDGTIGAFAYLLFVLLYVPCVSTTAAMLKEVNVKWTLFSVVWTTLVAYAVAVSFYQLATFERHPLQSLSWLLAFFCLFSIVIYHLYRYKAPKMLPTPIVIAHEI